MRDRGEGADRQRHSDRGDGVLSECLVRHSGVADAPDSEDERIRTLRPLSPPPRIQPASPRGDDNRGDQRALAGGERGTARGGDRGAREPGGGRNEMDTRSGREARAERKTIVIGGLEGNVRVMD